MLSAAKLAAPSTAATVVVPASVAALAPVPAVIATVTSPVKPRTGFPHASHAATCTAGVSGTPAVPLLGCPPNTSCVAGPGVTVTATVCGSVSPATAALTV